MTGREHKQILVMSSFKFGFLLFLLMFIDFYFLFYFVYPCLVSFISPCLVKFPSFCDYFPRPNVFHLCWFLHLCLITLITHAYSFCFQFVLLSSSVVSVLWLCLCYQILFLLLGSVSSSPGRVVPFFNVAKLTVGGSTLAPDKHGRVLLWL